ncbi:hypothetical protein MBRA1_001198 [Malassezia brasiliensis]|uniref:DUF155 domain-containing protein n=1 Tax=Malassezia brasiliensis TaxID=1821822 RepID=A0AAF0DRY5_9BASI|nr:hypothetical protein MBRA1_001198 [Malassezia brasiliensis]
MEQSMTPKERAHVLVDDNEQRILQRLLDVWTYKEAYTKSIGVGLGYDFRQVEVAFWKEPIEVWSHGKQVEAIQWTQVRLPPAREGSAPSQVVIAMDGSSEPVRTISVANASAHALRRARLPVSKAKALANASKALREQVAQESSTDAVTPPSPAPEAATWDDSELASALPLSASHLTSSDLPEVAALATAQSYNFDVLLTSGRLPDTWRWLEDREVIYIPSWRAGQPGSGSVFIFSSGCYVTWGMSSEMHSAFYHDVIQGGPVSIENGRYDVPGDEAMEYVHLPNETTRVVGDLIVVGQPPNGGSFSSLPLLSPDQDTPRNSGSFTLQSRLAFSQGVAASARLSVQEAVLSAYLASVSPIPSQLEADGQVPLGRREVIRKLGTLLSMRQRVNLDRDNFIDDPELYWENSRMEALYRSTCTALDIQPRFEALNEKLNHCENLLGVLRALLTEESSHRMELIIIYLIAFEVGMALVSHEH